MKKTQNGYLWLVIITIEVTATVMHGDGNNDNDGDGSSNGGNGVNGGVSACMIGVLRPAQCWLLLRRSISAIR